jgi:hypothetical protein
VDNNNNSHHRVPRRPPLTGYSDCVFQRFSHHEAIVLANESTAYAAWMLQVSGTVGARTGTAYLLLLPPMPAGGGAAADDGGGGGGGRRSPQATESRIPLFIIP